MHYLAVFNIQLLNFIFMKKQIFYCCSQLLGFKYVHNNECSAVRISESNRLFRLMSFGTGSNVIKQFQTDGILPIRYQYTCITV